MFGFSKKMALALAKRHLSTFSMNDMYTILDENGERNLELEHALGQVENDFVSITRNKLEPQLPLQPNERMALCFFIAAMHARTRANREHVRATWTGPLEQMNKIRDRMKTGMEKEFKVMAGMAAATSSSGPGLTYGDVERMVEQPLQTILPAQVAVAGPLLYELDLAVITTHDPVGFITSDNPCVWWDNAAYKRPPFYRSPALMYDSIEITLPVSRFTLKGAAIGKETSGEISAGIPPDGGRPAAKVRQRGCSFGGVRRPSTSSLQVADAVGTYGTRWPSASGYARVYAGKRDQPTQASTGREGSGDRFFQRCLAKSRGSTPEERKHWREGIYDQIREVMSRQGKLSAERMCALAVVSRAGFYRSFQQREPDLEEMELRSAIQVIAIEHKLRYGYRRLTAELRHRGFSANHKRVVRLMRLDNLLSLWRSAFVSTTDSAHEFKVHVNLASRMQLSGINQLWLADITFVRLQQEFVYLAVLLDAFSRRVVGWALDRSLAAQLAVAALQQAIANRRPAPGLVHHSDRGIQYVSAEYENVLDKHRMIASMSRLGNPWENAKCESFMKTLKQEEIRANEYRDLEHLRKNVKEFVEQYYNGQRLHSALGYQTPEAFENNVTPATDDKTESVSFLRHEEIYQSDVLIRQKPPEDGFPIHRVDESPTDYSLPGWSPPEPDSASPVSVILKRGRISGKEK